MEEGGGGVAGRRGHFDILFLINCRSQKNLANGPKVGSHFLVQKGRERAGGSGRARKREIEKVSERERERAEASGCPFIISQKGRCATKFK